MTKEKWLAAQSSQKKWLTTLNLGNDSLDKLISILVTQHNEE